MRVGIDFMGHLVHSPYTMTEYWWYLEMNYILIAYTGEVLTVNLVRTPQGTSYAHCTGERGNVHATCELKINYEHFLVVRSYLKKKKKKIQLHLSNSHIFTKCVYLTQ